MQKTFLELKEYYLYLHHYIDIEPKKKVCIMDLEYFRARVIKHLNTMEKDNNEYDKDNIVFMIDNMIKKFLNAYYPKIYFRYDW